MRLSNNLENKTPSDIYWRVQLVYTKVPAHSFPDTFHESRFVMTFLTILEVIEISCSFRLVLEWKTGKDIPWVLRKVFRKKLGSARGRR